MAMARQLARRLRAPTAARCRSSFATAALIALLALSIGSTADAQKPSPPYQVADAWIAANAETLRAVNRRIWSHPELGLQEHYSAAQLIALLEREGFTVERGVADMPTAFVATAGSGSPIVGVLAEYDALPGVSQAAAPERRARDENPQLDAGHACGHSVFGTASTAAAIAALRGMRSTSMAGTVRLYGTPAEETGVGKVYMARAGLFDDLDAAFHWHAADKTRISYMTCKAVISVKFRFFGLNAHASMSPHQGRSALDAVELMNVGANYLREHLKDDARIHYVITDGGGQPNVVPPTAEVWYYLRADHHADAEYMLERMREIADGAARMTRTSVEEQIDADSFELLPNRELSEVLQRHLERVGPPVFDDSERRFAKRTQAELVEPPDEPLHEGIVEFRDEPWHMNASTDVGNVSWRVPTGGLNVACYTNGAPGHSWQIVACTGMSIGEKGMIVAARTIAGAMLEFMSDAHVRSRAQEDFQQRRNLYPEPQSALPKDQRAPASIR
jgi:aminobenzoyl-glutamate utilization protein B